MDRPEESLTVSMLLTAREGDSGRMEKLFPDVYDQLRASAQKMLASEAPGMTLQATALVHEVYLKLMGPRKVPWRDRAHFYAAAVQAMRRILIDQARSRAGRRLEPGEARRRALKMSGLGASGQEIDLDGFLALDEVLIRLEGADPQAAAVVRLRFLAGLGIEETAEALGVSPRTVKRDWVFARGWLREALEQPQEG